MKKIIHFLHVKAAPASVFGALTTRNGLSGWWSTQVELEPGVGGIIDFRFLEEFNPDMEVTDLDPNRLVRWKCVGGHENWLDNTFSFELRPSDGATDLLFVQLYSTELSDEVYGNYNFNWGYYLGSLKQFCETGDGTPFVPA